MRMALLGPHWMMCVSPTNARCPAWKHSSVTFLPGVCLHRRYACDAKAFCETVDCAVVGQAVS